MLTIAKRQRLLPSTVFGIICVGLVVWYSQTYVPPEAASRLWNDIPPSVATILGLSASMLAVTFLWHWPRAWRILNRTAIITTALPLPFAILGNIFSHQTFRHLGANVAFMTLYGISCQ